MKIAICDDEKNMLDYLVNSTNNVLAEVGLASASVSPFSSGEEILEHYSEDNPTPFDLVMLDIKMDGINGMETAKKIREFDSKVYIIFITSSAEFVFGGYEVKAFRYILKSDLEFGFAQSLKTCLREMSVSDDKTYTFTFKGDTVILPISSIIYFESEKRIAIIHSKKGEYRLYEKLDNIEENFRDDNFVRCHQSFLVNTKFIKECSAGRLTLTDNISLPISKKYQKAVNDAFMWSLK